MDFTPRRIFLFVLFSALVLISWNSFVIGPMQRAQQAAKQRAAQAEQAANQAEGDAADKAHTPLPALAEKPAKPKPAEERPKANPQKEVVLGSLDPDSGFFQQVTLTTAGAAVSKVELNDPRYRNLEDPKQPLALVQPVESGNETFRTFDTSFPEIDDLLYDSGIRLDTVDWNIVQSDEKSATFEYVIPNAFRLTKTFKLSDPVEGKPTKEVRATLVEGYFLTLSIQVENLQDERATVHYELQGPVGMPLEDAESTRKFRDIKLGTRSGGKVKHTALTAKDLVKAIKKDDVEEWSAPFRYVGVDGQFFATLITGGVEEDTTKTIEKYIPEALDINQDEPQKSDVSLLFTSQPIELGPGETSKAQEYTLFSGPKREALLDKMQAGDILEFGWFGLISRGMLWILSFLHHTLFFPYGLAIIGLTIMVRGALFPLSRKQAHSAARMKELQPRLQELKKRYGNDKQKFAQAQMDLFRETGYNPFAGCLPILLQLPIFIGLYSALGHAVDLRGTPFLWINNLAAPDKLFQWPGGFRLPFLGHYFNLLPIVTVVLFLVQQKMFMPAPDPDDEQAVMTHKVMNFMMIFMGFLFYHVPAGLCVYFIASSLWGMGERKLLDYQKNKKEGTTEGDESAAPAKPPVGGLFKTVTQNGQKKPGSQKHRGKQSKSRR